nr:hypothetical protein [Tanacetum cinerariifolium]
MNSSEREMKRRDAARNHSRHGRVMTQEHMAWKTDYCIMKEGMSILRGRKSVPGIDSSEREMERRYYSAFM